MIPEEQEGRIQYATIVGAAERLLTRLTGAAVRLGDPERLTDADRRNTILRCPNLADSSPRSFIIMQVVAEGWDPDIGGSWDTQRFFRDWSGVRFLTELAKGVAGRGSLANLSRISMIGIDR